VVIYLIKNLERVNHADYGENHSLLKYDFFCQIWELWKTFRKKSEIFVANA